MCKTDHYTLVLAAMATEARVGGRRVRAGLQRETVAVRGGGSGRRRPSEGGPGLLMGVLAGCDPHEEPRT